MLKTVFKAGIGMGFLDFLSTKPKDISIEESRQMIFKEFEQQEKELLDYSSKKFAELKYLLISLSKTASLLETQKINLEEGNKRYRQIVATSQKNLVRQLKGLSHKLVPPNSFDLDSLENYSQKALNSVTNDLMPYWKNISLAKLELNKEMNIQKVALNDLLKERKVCKNQRQIESLGMQLINKDPQDQSAYYALMQVYLVKSNIQMVYLMAKLGERAIFHEKLYNFISPEGMQNFFRTWLDVVFNRSLTGGQEQVRLEIMDCQGNVT
ncbi:hypothetical protein IIC68_00815, partial [archaeon]|nr:hypothetical protein [archaeon]